MTEAPGRILQARLALDVRDRELAEEHAETLRDAGFKVLKVAPRGVSFEGETQTFETLFRSPVQEEPTTRFSEEPTLPESLSEHVASVYFPTKPEFPEALNQPPREEPQ